MTAIRHTVSIPPLTYRAGRVERVAHSVGAALLSWALSRAPQPLTHEQQVLRVTQEATNRAVAHAALRLYQLR